MPKWLSPICVCRFSSLDEISAGSFVVPAIPQENRTELVGKSRGSLTLCYPTDQLRPSPWPPTLPPVRVQIPSKHWSFVTLRRNSTVPIRHRRFGFLFTFFFSLPLLFLSGCVTSTLQPRSSSLSVPSIVAQPSNQSVTVGQPAFFSVALSSNTPVTYQWKKNNTILPGAIFSGYSTSATAASDNGSQFSVVITNPAGVVTSTSAVLTVAPSIPPLLITTNLLPADQIANPTAQLCLPPAALLPTPGPLN